MDFGSQNYVKKNQPKKCISCPPCYMENYSKKEPVAKKRLTVQTGSHFYLVHNTYQAKEPEAKRKKVIKKASF